MFAPFLRTTLQASSAFGYALSVRGTSNVWTMAFDDPRMEGKVVHFRVLRSSFIYVPTLILLLAPLVSTPTEGQERDPGDVPGITDNPLTSEQKKRIATVRAETEREIRAIQSNPRLNEQQKAQRVADARKRSHERIMAELTAPQRAEFQKWWDSRSEAPPGVGRGPSRPRSPSVPEPTQRSPEPLLPMLREHPLTTEQKLRMDEIRAASREQAERIEGNPDIPPEQKTQMLEAIRRNAHEQFVEMLTMEQVEEILDWLSRRGDPQEKSRQRI